MNQIIENEFYYTLLPPTVDFIDEMNYIVKEKKMYFIL